MAFVAECRSDAKCQLWCEFKPCYAQFSFANSQKSRVYERLVIHCPEEPPCSTEIEILEEGTVPILLSLEQMRNLYMKFEHTPECDYLTCAAFGMEDFPIPISTSNHILLDLAAMKNNPTGCGKVVECTWLTESIDWAKSARIENILEGKPCPQDIPTYLSGTIMQVEGNAQRVLSMSKDEASVSDETLFHVGPKDIPPGPGVFHDRPNPGSGVSQFHVRPNSGPGVLQSVSLHSVFASEEDT